MLQLPLLLLLVLLLLVLLEQQLLRVLPRVALLLSHELLLLLLRPRASLRGPPLRGEREALCADLAVERRVRALRRVELRAQLVDLALGGRQLPLDHQPRGVWLVRLGCDLPAAARLRPSARRVLGTACWAVPTC